eukprot:gene9500-1706_t
MDQINITELLIDRLSAKLFATYKKTFGSLKPEYAEIITWSVQLALETISLSDALYHNMEHTTFVTLVGQEILRGKHIKEGNISPLDWLHCTISLLCHDIGYIKGICKYDEPLKNIYSTGKKDETFEVPSGSTDAGLTKYHVDRGKAFVKQRFENHPIIDYRIIQQNIELTRFPVPNDDDHKDTKGFPGVVRGADLLGQMSDPRYLQKIPALFYEFKETGHFEMWKTPEDLQKGYPTFFWKGVYPYVQDCISYLKTTTNGRQYLANLYSNVFIVEHKL